MNNYEVWLENVNADAKRVLQNYTNQERDKYFGSELSFGTAGIRGEMVLGTNAMNEYMVAKYARAIAFFAQENQIKEMIIGFDTRFNSQNFANLTAGILSKYGIKVILFKEYAPTPLITFSAKLLKDYALIFTASHNPKVFNGMKVVMPNGAQIGQQIADEIQLVAKNISPFDAIKDFDQKISFNIFPAPQQLEDAYVEVIRTQFFKNIAKSKIIYTPLNGTGGKLMKKFFYENNIKIKIPSLQEHPDPNFATCTYPNPEMEDAFEQALKLTDKYDADAIIANDPDADRLGAMIKTAKGKYRLLSGNEIAILLLNHCLMEYSNSEKLKVNRKTASIVSTVVTTPLLKIIAEKNGLIYSETLTGFKNISQKMFELEKLNTPPLFACEESCGYIVNGYMHDKDGISAGLMLAQVVGASKKGGFDNIDALLESIYGLYGSIASASKSVMFDGANSKSNMDEFVENIRKYGLEGFDGFVMTDYLDSAKTGLESSNFLKFESSPNNYFIIRPSGTEPKLKIYCFSKGENIAIATEHVNSLCNKVTAYIKLKK